MVAASHPELTVYDREYLKIRHEVKDIFAVKDA